MMVRCIYCSGKTLVHSLNRHMTLFHPEFMVRISIQGHPFRMTTQEAQETIELLAKEIVKVRRQ